MIGYNKTIYWLAALVLAGIGIGCLFLPTIQMRIISRGVDEFEAHWPLYGSHARSQEINLEADLAGAGAILVDLRHKNDLSDVQVSVRSKQTAEILATAVIAKDSIRDDAFSHVRFNSPINRQHKTVILSFSAPTATLDNAIGIRTEGKPKNNLAIVLFERVPVGRAVINNLSNNRDKIQPVATALLAAVLVAAVAVKMGWQHVSAKADRRLEKFFIGLIILSALVMRISWLPLLHGVSGGDPYNYLSITKSIVNGENPLASEKRLPGLPILLIPTYLSTYIDDIAYMRIVEIISAGIILYCLFALAKSLGLPWPVQLIAPALLSWQKDFFWTSLRPEPYTFYTALLMLSLVLFLNIKAKWSPLFLGLTLGYAAMTRHEGFVLAVTLGAGALLAIVSNVILFPRKSAGETGFINLFRTLVLARHNGRYMMAFGIALVVVAPYFVHSFIAYGNPFYTPYFAGERLNMVNSWEAWRDNQTAGIDILGSLWRPSWKQLQETRITEPLLAASWLTTIIWWWTNRLQQKRLSRLAGAALQAGTLIIVFSVFIAFLVFFVSFRPLFISTVSVATAGMLLASLPLFLAATSFKGLLVLAVLLGQIMIPLWFHPFAKHMQQSIPLLILILTASLFLLANRKNISGQTIDAIKIASLLVPFSLVSALLFSQAMPFIDAANTKTALDHVLYQALKVAQRAASPHGFDNDYQPAFVYFGDQAKIYPGDLEPIDWLKANNINTMLTTSIMPEISWPDGWSKIASFKTEGEDEKLISSTVWARRDKAR